MNSIYDKYTPFPGQFALPPGDRKDAISDFWNKINNEAEDMVETCALSSYGFDKFIISTHKHFDKVMKQS